MPGLHLKFKQCLAAYTTGRTRFFHKIAVLKGCDRHLFNAHSGIIGAGIVAGTALGTDAGKSGVFLIGSLNEHTVIQ